MVIMNDLELPVLSYYVIYYEKLKNVIQWTEKVALIAQLGLVWRLRENKEQQSQYYNIRECFANNIDNDITYMNTFVILRHSKYNITS